MTTNRIRGEHGEHIEHRGRRHHHPRGRGRAAYEETGHGARGRRRGGRVPRGDVRTAILLLLDEQPMHGYQLMQSIADRTGGRWSPSPGAVYPTINQLEDEGLVVVTADAGRKLVTLTDTGRNQLVEHRENWGDPFSGYDETTAGPDLRRLVQGLHEATRQIGRAGTDAQREAAAKILADARRSLYLLLADGADEQRDV
jgi:DNA-binding PadR family transcriptional regulator